MLEYCVSSSWSTKKWGEKNRSEKIIIFCQEKNASRDWKTGCCLKGVERSENFPLYIESYLKVIYCHMHEDDITVETILPVYIEEFFTDHLLRKVSVATPDESIEWPPALKLFFTFLHEPCNIEYPEKIIK